MNSVKKWYIYQKERFPILIYGLYVFIIVFGVFCYNAYYGPMVFEKISKYYTTVSPEVFVIDYIKLIPMFAVTFLQFLMIRIMEEFRNYKRDCKFRPNRPVARGLIKLEELRILFIICIVLQIIITCIVNPRSMFLLIAVWLFFMLMNKRFFLKEILDKHFFIEKALNQFLMPILVYYISSFIYYIDLSFIWKLLIMSYIVSWIVEIASKMNLKKNEKYGIELNMKKSVEILCFFEILLMIIQLIIFEKKYLILILGVFVLVCGIDILCIKKHNRGWAKLTELAAYFNIIIAYLSFGLLIIK